MAWGKFAMGMAARLGWGCAVVSLVVAMERCMVAGLVVAMVVG